MQYEVEPQNQQVSKKWGPLKLNAEHLQRVFQWDAKKKQVNHKRFVENAGGQTELPNVKEGEYSNSQKFFQVFYSKAF